MKTYLPADLLLFWHTGQQKHPSAKGRLQYDRKFLLSLRYTKFTVKKPSSLPSLEIVLSKIHYRATPNMSIGHSRNGGKLQKQIGNSPMVKDMCKKEPKDKQATIVNSIRGATRFLPDYNNSELCCGMSLLSKNYAPNEDPANRLGKRILNTPAQEKGFVFQIPYPPYHNVKATSAQRTRTTLTIKENLTDMNILEELPAVNSKTILYSTIQARDTTTQVLVSASDKDLEEFVTCEICEEIYNEDLRCPRVLTCGHSFCSSCIQKLLAQGPKCPLCQIAINKERLEDISINYASKKLVAKFAHMSAKSFSNLGNNLCKDGTNLDTHSEDTFMKAEGFCEQHQTPKRFRCVTCHLWICGDCAFLDHKKCEVLLVKDFIDRINKENNEKIQNHLECNILEIKGFTSKLLNHYNGILKEKKEQNEEFQKKMNAVNEEIKEVNEKKKEIANMETMLSSLKEELGKQMQAISPTSSYKDVDTVRNKLTKCFNSLEEMKTEVKGTIKHEMEGKIGN